MPYAFGVDGGASKSRAVLLTTRGEVLHIARGPGVNYHEAGAQNAVATLSRLFKQCLEASRARAEECAGMCFGLAGVGRPRDKETLTPLLDSVFRKDAFLLYSDAEIALASGTLSESGILVIAGTGSMVFGKTEDGGKARCGGHGPLLSDEGSGYRIGLDGLRAAVRAHDGVDEPTPLSARLPEHLKLNSMDELIGWVNSNAATREKIAALAPLAVRAAEEDDPAADRIVHAHADALAVRVSAVHKKLRMPPRVDVVLSGGLLRNSAFYRQLVQRKILYLLPGAGVMAPKLEPVLGAALYALAKAGVEIDNGLLDIMKRTHQECAHKLETVKPVMGDETPSPREAAGSETGSPAAEAEPRPSAREESAS